MAAASVSFSGASGGADAVAAAVERLAAEVERERELRLGQVRDDAHVGVARVHVRAGAELLAQPVHDRVLDLQRHEARVACARCPCSVASTAKVRARR